MFRVQRSALLFTGCVILGILVNLSELHTWNRHDKPPHRCPPQKVVERIQSKLLKQIMCPSIQLPLVVLKPRGYMWSLRAQFYNLQSTPIPENYISQAPLPAGFSLRSANRKYQGEIEKQERGSGGCGPGGYSSNGNSSICRLVAQTVKNPPAMRETWVWSLGWEDPLDEGMATHSNILAWTIHGQRSLLGSGP